MIDQDSPPSSAESIALRTALLRLEQDNYALQQALSRVTDERDYWRDIHLTKIERDQK